MELAGSEAVTASIKGEPEVIGWLPGVMVDVLPRGARASQCSRELLVAELSLSDSVLMKGTRVRVCRDEDFWEGEERWHEQKGSYREWTQ